MTPRSVILVIRIAAPGIQFRGICPAGAGNFVYIPTIWVVLSFGLLRPPFLRSLRSCSPLVLSPAPTPVDALPGGGGGHALVPPPLGPALTLTLPLLATLVPLILILGTVMAVRPLRGLVNLFVVLLVAPAPLYASQRVDTSVLDLPVLALGPLPLLLGPQLILPFFRSLLPKT